ncbi:MAG TPA: DUF2520 domain-containing protein [Planctomycetota bacterium]|nr:DUF2520 domain-containing protein [Planctomycetota bacterium]HRT94833.1 DUF2520 domain-containing protein [Planctomycetota bacterium]
MVTDRKFAIVGAGAVGRSLAAALRARGAQVAAVASRTMASARAGAALAGSPLASTDLAVAARLADAVALCVPDDVVAAVCQSLAQAGAFEQGDVAFHFSGALPSQILAPAQACGASVLSFHPVQTFAHPHADAFRGAYCVLEGDEAGVAFGRELAALLGATPVAIGAADKPLYHAALCLACNYLVTLADLGTGLLRAAGLGDHALSALLPLLRGAVENLARLSPAEALTGPISRGDVATLHSHLRALAGAAPALLPLYRSLGLHTLALAVRKGTLAEDRARAVRELLEASEDA